MEDRVLAEPYPRPSNKPEMMPTTSTWKTSIAAIELTRLVARKDAADAKRQ